ncbi:hypothetical protein BDV98DRAFT_580801 [Pterulicium gracile]|uniref:Uncharacterized protein n=1 Tax=Pterulicium gracile TaxID=1884261 RepID=A0A5C3QTR4_9AGAR|nr:hypothetical protein BDV98DRAFT_580801 [Pterula gracilis]
MFAYTSPVVRRPAGRFYSGMVLGSGSEHVKVLITTELAKVSHAKLIGGKAHWGDQNRNNLSQSLRNILDPYKSLDEQGVVTVFVASLPLFWDPYRMRNTTRFHLYIKNAQGKLVGSAKELVTEAGNPAPRSKHTPNTLKFHEYTFPSSSK